MDSEFVVMQKQCGYITIKESDTNEISLRQARHYGALPKPGELNHLTQVRPPEILLHQRHFLKSDFFTFDTRTVTHEANHQQLKFGVEGSYDPV
jgi:hypothetical protein